MFHKIFSVFLIAAVYLLFLGSSKLTAQQPPQSSESSPQNNEIIISASKNDTTTGRTGNQVVIITKSDIEKSGAKTIRDAIAKVQGISISASGNYGAPASLYMRGSDSAQLLVLIDGVALNDPMSIGRGFDFSRLSVLNIDRIEIIYGAQSTLYGSNASAGVINIVTAKGDKESTITVSSEAGSNRTFNETFTVSGKKEKTSYSFAARRSDSQGISKAEKNPAQTGSFDNDGFHSTEFSSRLHIPLNSKVLFDSTLRFEDAQYDTDDSSFTDDKNHIYTSRLFSAGSSLSWDTFSWWRNIFSYSTSSTHRKDSDPIDADGNSTDSWFEGKSQKGEWRNIFSIADCIIITAGTEHYKETGSNINIYDWGTSAFPEKSASTSSGFALGSLTIKDVAILSSGARFDKHSDFGRAGTWNASGVITLPIVQTKIRGSYATSFKAPSLYQLFAPTYGNDKLDPERGKSIDAGIEQPFGNILEYKGSWFLNRYTDMIGYTTKYENIGKTETKGFENSLKIMPVKNMTIQGQYTYTIARDMIAKTDLLRRPKHKGSVSLNFEPIESLNVYYESIFNGKCSDKYFNMTTFQSENKTLDRYILSNAHISYTLLKKYTLYVHCDNISDKKYTEVYGYESLGRTFTLGAKADF